MEQTQAYDIAIIGAGPAGLTAALYAARARLKVVMIDKLGFGGQMLLINEIENYPGFVEPISGFDLAERMHDQAIKYGALHVTDTVKSITKSGAVFEITGDEKLYVTSGVVLALGAKPRPLDVPGEFKYRGKGVSYCAVCDGAFFKDKKIAVVGGGNSALEEAEYLSRIAKEVVIIHRRGELRADKIYQERLTANPKVTFLLHTTVESIEGGAMVERLVVKNGLNKKTREVPFDGVFVLIGHVPETEPFKDFVMLDAHGFVKTDERYRTSVPGVYATGDCRRTGFWQLVTACAEGAEAVHYLQEYLKEVHR